MSNIRAFEKKIEDLEKSILQQVDLFVANIRSKFCNLVQLDGQLNMPELKATCVLAKPLINGLKYAEFAYKHDFFGTYYLESYRSFNVVLETYPSKEDTEADDFKLIVSIELQWIPADFRTTRDPNLLYINSITIKSCNKNICGEVELHSCKDEDDDEDESESEDEDKVECGNEKEEIFKFRDTDTDAKGAKCVFVTFPTNKIKLGNRNFVFKVYYSEKDRVRETVYDYEPYFADKSMSDVTIVFPEHDDEEIPAHRVILAAHNEVFAEMFKSEMLEKNGTIEIQDIEPHIFKLLLRYIYSGKLHCDNASELAKLMVAADKYSVVGLVYICDERLTEKVDFRNAVELLISADLVRANALKMKCIDVIVKNKSMVITRDDYKEMVKAKRADLISELFCRDIPINN